MSELKMLTCDVCGGLDESDARGWLTVYGRIHDSFMTVHFCSGRCLAEFGTRLSLSEYATRPCHDLDERDEVTALAAAFARPSATKAARPRAQTRKPKPPAATS